MKQVSTFILFLFFNPFQGFTQFFEGELKLVNRYLDNESYEDIVKPKSETITMKEGYQKCFLHNAKNGQLEWEIYDFASGYIYSRKSGYENLDGLGYAIIDKPPTIENGKMTFDKLDSVPPPPINKKRLCKSYGDTTIAIYAMDTTVVINKFECAVFLKAKNGEVVAEYFVHLPIKVDSLNYQCHRVDDLDLLYGATKGGLIIQSIHYTDLYIYFRQFQELITKEVSDEAFIMPKGVEIKIVE